MKIRENQIEKLTAQTEWDIIIIGGGATGLGCAVDAASRGFKTLLLEQADFAKGTSSRSTKLVHGGVRYLAAGDVLLVYEALRERGLLLQNAPHIVKKQAFIIPCYSLFEKIKYVVGLTLYDALAGKFSFGASRILKKEKVRSALPGLNVEKLKGAVEYQDGQFDDARLAINLAQTAIESGATVLNYVKVEGLINEKGLVIGVKAKDIESDKSYVLRAKAVINATGVFVDDILTMDKPGSKPLVMPSQGVHVVLDRSFMPATAALMIPETTDGRVLFVVPWHEHLLVGTTDTPLKSHSLEPVALDQEISFIIETAGEYLEKRPTNQDILSVFAGLRPLAAPDNDSGQTKEISRSHKLMVSSSKLITITGGKWTTYRKMAEDTINKVIAVSQLSASTCVTKNLAIHGSTLQGDGSHFDIYGSDAEAIKSLIAKQPELSEKLAANFPNVLAEVLWAVRHEMARTVEDVLARRLRILFLDAKASIEMAPKVAEIIAGELGFEKAWEQQQIDEFSSLARNYLVEF